MVLQAHLALEGREHRLDDEAAAGLADLCGRALAEPVLVGHDELDADQPEAGLVLTAALTGVGEQQAAGVRAGELKHALTLVLARRPQVVAERRPVAVADEEQAHAPVPAALGGAVAVGGLAGEPALAGAAGVVRAGKQGAVGEAHAAAGEKLGEAELHPRDLRRQAPQAAAQLRLTRQLREAARQQAPDRAEELAVGDPVSYTHLTLP